MIKESAKKTFRVIKITLPIVFGVLMLLSLLNPLFQKFYPVIFTGNYFLDPLIGAVAGSIAFGIPITAYVAGGELLNSGVSLLAVAAFVLAWSTVGIAMLPFEIKFLGKKFAIYRNAMNFFMAIIISIFTVITLNFLNLK